ncbi:MAG TPA: oxidoreductase [Actinophytocola sp.]|uniref:oxidoreductase n=1 Tax=Actinophytocola sp. TaxID=1872138 RepID=UPI002DB771AD|nr:oxidoreductase [Actinophytocola sp.]HEU5472338.1 oxidoreductase [Actinophytocola sp.]
METINDAAALDLPVPAVPFAPRGIAWLRASVARFSTGADHDRRRALAVAALATVDPAALRRRAAELAGSRPPDLIAVEVLAEALGVTGSAEAVAAVARAYHPHLPSGPDTDAAVAELVAGCGEAWDEPTAARIGLLVQACAATAGLAGAALRRPEADADAAVAAALRDDPPVRITRRVRDGRTVLVDISALPFGSGPHACPGQPHAVAIAAGIVEGSPR